MSRLFIVVLSHALPTSETPTAHPQLIYTDRDKE